MYVYVDINYTYLCRLVSTYTLYAIMHTPVPAISAPLCAAEVDSEVTVAARGYSPPTPMPSSSL